jgi:hypothetical protein
VQGSGLHHSIDDYKLGDYTIKELFGQLKELDLLTGKAEKEAKVTICITIFKKVHMDLTHLIIYMAPTEILFHKYEDDEAAHNADPSQHVFVGSISL